MSAVELLERNLAAISDPAGEGSRAFLRLSASAGAAAEAQDKLLPAGLGVSLLAGRTIAIKDNCDIAGEPTPAGSVILADSPIAVSDSPVVARLRNAGMIVVGRTNMTEFAFSGIGANPHYGTPANPWDRAARRIPGGSSSGSAVAVADGMAWAGLGTDTGGSVRIPAALCGLAGFKPTARRVPRDGVLPLSTILDSIGPIASTALDCALLDAALAGEPIRAPAPMSLAGLRLLVPRAHVLDGLDEAVSTAFEAALRRLADAGAHIFDGPVPELDDVPKAYARGSIAGAEAAAWHANLIGPYGDRYDPNVRIRIERSATMMAADLVQVMWRRTEIIARFEQRMAGFDALVMPTVAIVAPLLSEVEDPVEFTRLNNMVLRNALTINFLDGCGLSLPCHVPGAAPVGISFCGPAMSDRRILAIGLSAEPVVAGQ